MKQNTKGSALIWIIIIFFIVVILATGAVFLLKNSSANQPPSSAANQQNGIPQAKVYDTAPQLPKNQKTEVVTMQQDSTYLDYLVPSQTVDSFVKSLPSGVTVVSKKPLQ